MAVTLNDWFKQAKDPLSKGFIADLLRYSDLIGMVPIETVTNLQVRGQRWQTLPGAAFRPVGGTYTESTGTAEEITETLAILGGDVKIDRVLLKATDVIENPLVTQMKMKAKAVAFTFNHYFINGDTATDPHGFEGIKKRVANMPSRMTINLNNLAVLASTGNEHTFIDALHMATKYVDNATAILVNEATYVGLGQVLRRLGLLETQTDAYGKVWDTFKGIPLVDVGLRADKSTEIISNAQGTGNQNTELFVVRMDTDDGLRMIQLKGTSPEPYDPLAGGESDAGPQFIRRIDWAVGLFNLSQYCICRVYDFRMASS